MNVLALCSYPIEAAATRFRLAQFVEPLRAYGIELTLSPFLDGRQFENVYSGRGIVGKALGTVPAVFRRFGEVFTAGKYEGLLVQREAMPFGPAIVEWLIQRIHRLPLVLDLDDATYVRYISPSYGRLGSAIKFFGKTDRLIRRADIVVCGNRHIAEHVESVGTRSVVIPTVVDTQLFTPGEHTNDDPVIGWIGTHSTFPFLESIFPALERLALTYKFKLKIVGAARENIEIPGVEVENLDWNLAREPEDFRSLDIGLYPLMLSDSANEQWLLGKSGFKAIQYMAVGIPFVMTPVGVCAEIGEDGVTHFNAETGEDWYNSLERLISDVDLRQKMGDQARDASLAQFGLDSQVEKMAMVLRSLCENGNTDRDSF